MSFFKKLFGGKKEPAPQPPPAPSAADILVAFKKAIVTLRPYKRTAYLPTVAPADRRFSPDAKIGGYPYLRNEQDWPVCPNCKKHMQLFVQLDLASLPTKASEGLIQLFYCTTTKPQCEFDLNAFSPFSKAVTGRKIELAGPSAQIHPILENAFEEKRIVGWEAVDDYPAWEEYDELGIDLDLTEEMEEDVYYLMEEQAVGLPVYRDKLFGWPYWVQGVEYPYDRQTEDQMGLLFQFCSEDNLPYMFGDAGVGHLTQSPVNVGELGFGWACS